MFIQCLRYSESDWGGGKKKKSNKAAKEFESHFDFVLQQIAHL